uniref:Pseudouridine synthase RsuA/RluA-like domain-containing protein n=1 Tax=Trieres chinensis TaxID=1514140 RepID=A0A7S2AAS9_TRICV|mmetsp:Transcript_9798/g.20719  ORF Transcript_9798/g.20719 Transcript_9798/m.20719 type:complete len:369 (+) Transcript_9798:3-1109(+)
MMMLALLSMIALTTGSYNANCAAAFCPLVPSHRRLLLRLSPKAHDRSVEASQRKDDMDELSKRLGPVPLLYESDGLLAVNKPPGISHHDDPTSGSPGFLSYIRYLQSQVTETDLSFPYKGRIYGVHRLDKATSGILLLAKDAETARKITECFKNKTVVKYYVALSGKKPRRKKQGWVKGDMARSRRGTWMLKKSASDPAITRFFTAGLGELTGSKEEDGNRPRTLILFRPHTGRTHQLRVAAKSLGLPILGDPYYGDSSGNSPTEGNSSSDIFHRTYLHAAGLHLALGEEQVTIWCSPPFGHLWDTRSHEGGYISPHTRKEPTEYEKCIMNIMVKHCDCNELTSVCTLSLEGTIEQDHPNQRETEKVT